MSFDIITVLDTCVDLVVNLGDTVPEFNQKEKWVDSFSLEMGGSSCIFACGCAKLGLKTVGVGVVGKDAFGKVVIDGLLDSGVDITYIKTDDSLSTGLGVLLTRGTDRAILTCSGTIGAVNPEQINDELLRTARHMHIGSYYLLTGMIDAFADISRRAKNYGLTISLDTNWDPSEEWILPDELLKYVDIFLPNENEAMLLTGINDVKEAAFYLGSKIPIVAVKQGEKGAMVVSGNELIHLDAINVPVIDTIGAGDSFDAGFIYAYLNDMELRECLRAGLYCGGMNTAQTGGTAGQPDADSLKRHMG